MALFSSPPRSLCVLRLSAIGDVSNAIAAIQALQAHWPETRLTWITGKAEAALIAPLLPTVTVIPFDKKKGWKGMKAVWQQLNGEVFDALLHMQTAIRASLLSLGIKARYRLGFALDRVSDLQQWFTNIKVPSPTSLHVLDGFLAFIEHLGVPNPKAQWSLPLSDKWVAWANHEKGDHTLLLVAPAASKAFKNWTVEGYAGVIAYAQRKGWKVVLVGGPDEKERALGEQIEQQLTRSHSADKSGDVIPITNLIGTTSLLQLVALTQSADMVIAPDSGPAHIANAVNTPVIGLYAHHNPARTGPYQYRDYVVSVYDEALFAETGKTPDQVPWRTRVKDDTAMTRIQLAQVIHQFDHVVKKEEINV